MLTKDQIKAAVMELDILEREALVEELSMLLRGQTHADIDAAWIKEIARREENLRTGKSKLIPYEEVMGNLRKNIAQPKVQS